MHAETWPLRGLRALLALALGLAPAIAGSAVLYWTLDATPPSSVSYIDDFHLQLQIVKTPFTFSGPTITDKGNFATATGTVPDSGGNFSIDLGGASPAYDHAHPFHIEFDMRSTEDVKIVGWTWTVGGLPVANGLPGEVTFEKLVVPEPPSLALAALALVVSGVAARGGRRSAGARAAYGWSSL